MTTLGIHKAPCGHPGVPVIGTYVMCPTCDRPKVASAPSGSTGGLRLNDEQRLWAMDMGRAARVQMVDAISMVKGLAHWITSRCSNLTFVVRPFKETRVWRVSVEEMLRSWSSVTGHLMFHDAARVFAAAARDAMHDPVLLDLADVGLKPPSTIPNAFAALCCPNNSRTDALRTAAVHMLDRMLGSNTVIYLPKVVCHSLSTWMPANPGVPARGVIKEVTDLRVARGEPWPAFGSTTLFADRAVAFTPEYLELDYPKEVLLSDVTQTSDGSIAIFAEIEYSGFRIRPGTGGQRNIYT